MNSLHRYFSKEKPFSWGVLQQLCSADCVEYMKLFSFTHPHFTLVTPSPSVELYTGIDAMVLSLKTNRTPRWLSGFLRSIKT